MAENAIEVRDLTKVYMVPEREGGLKAAVTSLFKRRTKEVVAVKSISFRLEPGEVVGFLGPNGAGKTTTIKMLAGLLHPTGGAATVFGYTPSRRERDYLRQITLVMGNRNQLQWDIPALDSFELNRAIYRLDEQEFRRTRDEFIELMDMAELVRKPVRNLSLGERMKVEIVASLLHRPQALFLDEPTIGLDVTMQRRIREFIAEYNRRTGATVLLTSHYMADVEALCRRIIVIHHGQLLFDGRLEELVDRFSGYKKLVVTLDADAAGADLAPYGEELERDGDRVTLKVRKQEVARITGRLLNEVAVTDLSVKDSSVEDVIETVFATENAEVEPKPAVEAVSP